MALILHSPVFSYSSLHKVTGETSGREIEKKTLINIAAHYSTHYYRKSVD